MTTAISPEMSRALSASAAELNPPAALKQYNSYRSAPDRFPAYDRMQFVRLPNEMLPAALRRHDDKKDGSPTRLTYWPAILYDTLHECIRDLPRNADAILKARLVVDHTRYGPRRVARLIGWRGVADTNGEGDDDETVFFPDTSVDLIRLTCGEGRDEIEGGEVLTFYEHQFDLEGACRSLIRAHSDVHKSASRPEGERDRREVLRYARKWKNALSMALNVLAVDVGQAAMPLKEEPVELSKESRQRTIDERASSNRVEAIKEEKGKRKALGDISNRPHNKIKIKQSVDRVSATDAPVQIAPHTPWKSVWKTLRSSGWTWRGGSGLMSDYYYVRPGKKVKGGQVGVDYFTSEEDVKDFCKRKYGWIGPPHEEEKQEEEKNKAVSRAAAAHHHNDNSCVTDSDSVDDEDVPPLISPIRPHSSWRSAWTKMLRSGWTWKEGSGLMMDYYYIKPGKRIKGGKPGVDYFVDRKSLQDFMKKCYGWHGKIDDVEAESMESDDESMEEKKPNIVKLEVKKMYSKSSKSNSSSIKHKSEIPSCASSNISDKSIESVSSFVSDFKDLWCQLKEEGWTVTKAGKYNRLHDWYWVRPGCDPGDVTTRLGEHYFQSEDDVMDFVKNAKAITAADVKSEKDAQPHGDGKTARPVKAEKPSESVSSFVSDFKELWCQLKEDGWTVIKAAKYNRLHDWYWVRPGCDPGDVTTRLGEHYFQSEEDVMNFVKNTKATTTSHAKIEKESKQQANSKTSSLKKADKPSLDFKDLWCQLKEQGWTVIKAGKYNRLHDWYWVRPGCDPGDVTTRLGEHYFQSEEDVMDFVKNAQETPDKDIKPQANSTTLCSKKAEKQSEPSSFISDWADLWHQLKQEGWTVIKAGKYNCLHDWYWVRPGCDPGHPSSIVGQDYFVSMLDVMEFVQHSNGTNENSKGRFEKEEDELSVQSFDDSLKKEESVLKPSAPVRSQRHQPLTPIDCKTKPQDPAIPLPFSPDSVTSTNSEDIYDWNNLWPTLQKAGWKVIRAGKFNKLHDWYYVRPNRDPADKNCKLGSHYFTTPDDVIQYVKMVDEESGSMGGKLGRKSMDVMLAAFEKEAENMGTKSL